MRREARTVVDRCVSHDVRIKRKAYHDCGAGVVHTIAARVLEGNARTFSLINCRGRDKEKSA